MSTTPASAPAPAASPQASRFKGPRRPVQRLATTKRVPGQPAFLRPPSLRASTPSRSRASMTCPNSTCPSPNIVEENGTQVCATCGVVARESNIVSEIQFGETSSGAAAVQGSYVGEGRTHGQSLGAPRSGIHDGLSSRELTTLNARREIDALILNLRIPSNLADPAVNIFKLSLAHAIYDSDGKEENGKRNFVQGRSIRTVAAVALYIACRRQKNTNTIMLIDLAETMTPQVSVFRLGNIYNRLVRAIWGAADGSVSNDGYIDPINPENLIRRFARELEFGSLVGKVTEDAIRLVQRMDRDWMTTGRRPAGICGAALILAARMNNFRRTVREVVLIVKVCEVTVNNRLEEFQNTDSSNLTVQELRQGANTTPCDPPAFYRAKEGGKKPQKRGRKRKNQAPETAAEIEGDAEDDEGPPRKKGRKRKSQAADNAAEVEDEEEDDVSLPKRSGRKRKTRGFETAVEIDDGEAEVEQPPRKRGRVDQDGFAIPDIPIDPALRSAASQKSPSDESVAAALISATDHIASETQQAVSNAGSNPAPSTAHQAETPKRLGRPKGSKTKHAPDATYAEIALESEIEQDILDTMNSEAMQRATPSATPAASARSTPVPETFSNIDQPSTSEPQLETTSEQPQGPNSNAQNLPQQASLQQIRVAQPEPRLISMSAEILSDEFDSDPEVANVILSEEEVRIKEHIWVEENKQWLRDEHAKRIKKQLQDAADIAAGFAPGESDERKKKKRRRGRRLGDVSYLKDIEESRRGSEGAGVKGDEAGRARRAASIAVQGMLEQRGYSRRLNYDALSKMFPDDMASVAEGSVKSRRMVGKPRAGKGQEREASKGTTASTASPSPDLDSALASTSSQPDRPVTQAQLPSPPATQREQQQPIQPSSQSTSSLSTSSSVSLSQTPTQPPQPPPVITTAAPAEGEEELIGTVSSSDSPLSSLPATRSYNSPILDTTRTDELGRDDDEESEGDPEDYVQEGDGDDGEEEEDEEEDEDGNMVEKALQGYGYGYGGEEELVE